MTRSSPLAAYWSTRKRHTRAQTDEPRQRPAAATPRYGISPLVVLRDAELDAMARVVDLIGTRRTQAEAAGFQFFAEGAPRRMAPDRPSSEPPARAPRARRDLVGVILAAIIGRAHDSGPTMATATTPTSGRHGDAILIFDLLCDADLAVARDGYACLERRCGLASAHGIVFRRLTIGDRDRDRPDESHGSGGDDLDS